MADATKRMNYFDRQFLRATDFQDEQTYELDRRRRHNRLLHVPGVAEGLKVTGNVGDGTVSVSAGTAYDGQGCEIVLAAAQQVSVAGISGATATAYITISYAEQGSDPSTDPGVSGNSTRTSETPALAASSSPPTAPNVNILLAQVAMANGKIAALPDSSVQSGAGTVLPTDMGLHSLTLTNNTIAATGYPKLACNQANYAALENASLAMDAGTEIVFQDNGQVRSLDQSHKLVFNRSNNLLELHEFGDIVLMTGGASPTEKFRVTAAGNVGVGTSAPDRPLTVQGNTGTYLNVRDKGDTGGPFEVLLGADTGGGIVSTMTNHDLQLRAGGNVTQVMIKANGNVGLGTTTPRSDLEVQTSNGGKLGPIVTLTNPAGGGGAAGSVDFNTYAPATTGTYNPSSRIEASDDANYSNSIVFLTNKPGAANNGLVERMRITSDGHLKCPMWNAIQVLSAQPGPMTGGTMAFSSGGGTLLIFASGSGYSTTAGAQIGMEIVVDAVVRGYAKTYTNEASSHKAFTANALLVSGIAAGSHTVALASWNNTASDGNDFFNLTIIELPF